MSQQEMQALENFLNQLTQAKAGVKDPQADALIANAVARQPDAAYLLVQRTLLLEQALAAAKSQISTLQSQLQAAQATQTAGSNSFFDPANAWGNNAVSPRPVAPLPATTPVAAAPIPTQYQNQNPNPPASLQRPGFLSGGWGSTLGNIATTAAGVAGGAFLFQGIENLLHHSSGSSGFSGFSSQPSTERIPTETTVVNNYYGSDRLSPDDVDMALDNSLDDGLPSKDMIGDDSSMI